MKGIDRDGRQGNVPNWRESYYGILFKSTESSIFLEILPRSIFALPLVN